MEEYRLYFLSDRNDESILYFGVFNSVSKFLDSVNACLREISEINEYHSEVVPIDLEFGQAQIVEYYFDKPEGRYVSYEVEIWSDEFGLNKVYPLI